MFLPIISFINTEERLFWFTKDLEIKTKTSVPKNLPEGKEENRVLPWVFHDSKETKKMKLNCIMRGYNASNNPINYKEARWSHPGFLPSQVDTSAEPECGNDGAVPYRIWTIEITTSAADYGKKWATCEFQQGDFPLSTDFKFLIFKKFTSFFTHSIVYRLEGSLDKNDITQQVEDDIKKEISEHYKISPESVKRYGQEFHITVPKKAQTKPKLPTHGQQKCKSKKVCYCRHPLIFGRCYFGASVCHYVNDCSNDGRYHKIRSRLPK